MRVIIIYTFRFISNHIKGFIASCLCLIISLVLLELSYDMYKASTYDADVTSKLLGPGISTDRVLYLTREDIEFLNENDFYDLISFLDDLKKIEGVKASGSYYSGNIYTKEMASLPAVIMDPALLQIVTGYDERLDIKSSDNEYQVVLGYNISKDYSPETFTYYKGDIPYDIVGIMPENTKWFGDSIPDLGIDLDNYVVISKEVSVWDDKYAAYEFQGYFEKILCLIDSSSDIEIVRKRIGECAEKNNIVLRCKSIREICDDYLIENRRDIESQFINFMAIFILTFIAVSSVCTVNILMRKKDYGILYCNGVTKMQTIIMCISETGIKVLIAGVVSYILAGTYGQHYSYGQASMVFNDIHRSMIGILILVCVGITIICSIMPLFILWNYKECELIKGRE